MHQTYIHSESNNWPTSSCHDDFGPQYLASTLTIRGGDCDGDGGCGNGGEGVACGH
jgi:hypothetical protein